MVAHSQLGWTKSGKDVGRDADGTAEIERLLAVIIDIKEAGFPLSR
jgi:hypothetical protein